MSAVIALLPDSVKPYAKTAVAVLGALLAVATQVLPFLPDAAAAAVTSAVAVLAALGVYATPNTDVEEPAGDEFSDDTTDDA